MLRVMRLIGWFGALAKGAVMINKAAEIALERLRSCQTVGQVNETARETDITAIKAGPDGATRIIHVKNLAALMRSHIGRTIE